MWQKTGVGSRLPHVKNPLFVLCKPMKSLGLRQLSIFYCFERLVLKLTCKCLKYRNRKQGMSILSFYFGKYFFVLEILRVGFWLWFFKRKSYRNFPMWNCDNRAQLMKKRPLTLYLRVQAIMRSPWSHDSFVWGKYFSYLTEFKKAYLSPWWFKLSEVPSWWLVFHWQVAQYYY